MQMIINGEYRDSRSGKTFDNINPYTGELVCKVASGTAEDFEEAARIAKASQPAWAATPFYERAAIIKRFVAYVREDLEKIAKVVTAEGGKTITDARGELECLCMVFESFLEAARHLYGNSVPLNAEPRTQGDPAQVDAYGQVAQAALQLAEQQNLDLVKIVPGAQPPVCKLMDYDKHRYEQSKRERELRKNQRIVTLKEVQLSATIEENDVQTKFKNAVKFLQDGDKVKVSIRFRGRQIAHADIGLKIMQDFAARIEEYGTIERRPMLEGRHMIMILAPKAEKKSFAEKSQQRKEKHAAAQAAKASEPEKRELKPQPKKKVKRESENMI